MSYSAGGGGFFQRHVFSPHPSTAAVIVTALRAIVSYACKVGLLLAVYPIRGLDVPLSFVSLRLIAAPAPDDAAAWLLALTLMIRILDCGIYEYSFLLLQLLLCLLSSGY